MAIFISLKKSDFGITKQEGKITFSKQKIVQEHTNLVDTLKKQPNKTPQLKELLKEQSKELSEYKEL